MVAVKKRIITFRLAILTAILLIELLAISLQFDAFHPELADSGRWFAMLSYSGHAIKILLAVIVFAALGMLPRLADHYALLHQSAAKYSYSIFVFLQLASYALFVWCTAEIFGRDSRFDEISSSLVLIWLGTLSLTVILWLICLAPISFWCKLLCRESKILIAALVVGSFAWIVSMNAQSLWDPLSIYTFQLSSVLLNLFYPEITVDPQLKSLGAQDFTVNIASECSGYEGMGLMAIFTTFYLSVFRKDFRFPQALLLFPIGITTIWLFNILRIVALISIGASYSPAVAIGGFHSQAGWISFIVVIVGTLVLAYKMPFFSTIPKEQAASSQKMTLPMALLIPFIVLLASTIITLALSADFDWFYPLRVIAVGAALAFCWRLYEFSWPKFNFEPWIAGVAVFFVWIMLVPDNATQDDDFAAELFAQPDSIVFLWMLFRVVGAVLTVPLAEELLFRGYLLSRIARQAVIVEGRLAFSWVALVVSSILFGLLHADWVAGIVAGFIFGLVRYRSDSIKNAIVAHSSANLLLSVYVISTGSWSLW